jgi:hypothetical protein
MFHKIRVLAVLAAFALCASVPASAEKLMKMSSCDYAQYKIMEVDVQADDWYKEIRRESLRSGALDFDWDDYALCKTMKPLYEKGLGVIDPILAAEDSAEKECGRPLESGERGTVGHQDVRDLLHKMEMYMLSCDKLEEIHSKKP